MAKYQLTAPPNKAKVKDEETGEWKRPLWSSLRYPNQTVWGVRIIDGKGECDNAETAVEFFDMGYAVEPDPHPEAKEMAEQRELEEQMRAIEKEEMEEVRKKKKRKELEALLKGQSRVHSQQ